MSMCAAKRQNTEARRRVPCDRRCDLLTGSRPIQFNVVNSLIGEKALKVQQRHRAERSAVQVVQSEVLEAHVPPRRCASTECVSGHASFDRALSGRINRRKRREAVVEVQEVAELVP